jgi:hypothetical protein
VSPVGAAAASACCWAASASARAAFRPMRQPVKSRVAPTSRKGRIGMPGMNPIAIAATPAIIRAFRDCDSWVAAEDPISDSAPDRVTIMPVETAMSSAGICVTRPSPIVRMPYFDRASVADSPFCSMPMAMPPIRLMMMIRMPAIASPLTNFDAPSIAP